MIRNALLIAGAAGFLLVAAPPARADGRAGNGERPLALADCLRIALEKNPAARSADSAAAGAGESAAAARGAYYPRLDFSSGVSRWQRRIFLPEGIPFPGGRPPTLVGPLDDYALSFNAAYTLFDSGQRKALLGAARAGHIVASARRDQVRQDVALEVIQAFSELQSAEQMRDVARVSLERAKDHVRIAKQRKEAGAVPLIDVLRARVEASNAELDLVRAEGDVRVAGGRLATSMGLPAETAPAIEAAPRAEEAPDEKDLPAALDRAARRRPSVQAAQAGVESARREVSGARSAFGPKVVASASYGWEDDKWTPSDRTWSVGVGVALPVFTGFSRVHELARARRDLDRAQADLEGASLAARQQAWNAFSSVEQAYQALQSTEALVTSARESHRLAGERYKVSAGTITDLLDAETALVRAEATRVSAQADYRTARARYLWSTGQLLPETE